MKSDTPYALFCAFVFLSMVSLPLARATMVAAFIALLCSKASRSRLRLTTPPAVGWYVYFLFAIVVTAAMALVNSGWGVSHGLIADVDKYIEPAKGCRKLTKLLWYLAIPLTVANVTTPKRFRNTLSLIVIGGLVSSFFIVLAHPVIAWLQTNFNSGVAALDNLLVDSKAWAASGGRPPSFHEAFVALGTMHDAQRLMVALVAVVVLLLSDFEHADRRRRLIGIATTSAIAVALVFTCKRGPLLVGILISFALLLPRIKVWRTLLIVAGVAALAFALPNSRTRLLDLPREFEVYQRVSVDLPNGKPQYTGGRMLMWTKMVPALHKEYPYGIGFRSLTALKMHNIDWHVEKNRTHVHSVPLQAFVDFGYIGIAAWALWFGLSFVSAFRTRRIVAASCEPLLAIAPLAMLSALFLFGFVEYNIADAAVVLPLSIVMGMCAMWFDAERPARCQA